MKTTRSRSTIIAGVIIFILTILMFNMAHVSAADSSKQPTTYTTKDGRWQYQVVDSTAKTVRLVKFISRKKSDYKSTFSIPSTIVSKKGVKYTVSEITGSRKRDKESEDYDYSPMFDTDKKEIIKDKDGEVQENYFTDNIDKIVIPSSVTKIGMGTFCSMYISEVSFGSGSRCKVVGEYAFGDNPLTNVALPAGLTTIGDWAFSGVILTKITLPAGLTSIGDFAFSNGSLTDVTIPANVTKIGDNAFCENSELKTVKFADGCKCTSIGDYAFSETLITKLDIPGKVTKIGEGAFSGCLELTSLTMPASVRSLGGGFIDGCNKLKSFKIPVGVKKLNLNIFSDCSKTTISFASGSQCTSICAEVNYLDENDKVATDRYAQYNVKLGNFVIPDSVKTIEAYAFSGSDITSLTFGKNPSCTKIEGNAFDSCTKLSSVKLPASLSSIGEYAFYGCSKLTSVVIDPAAKIKVLPNNLFWECTSLKSFTVPAGVTKIETECFSRCKALASVTFEKNSKCSVIENYAFAGCKSLGSIKLPAAVTELWSGVFMNCPKLALIDIAADDIIVYSDTFATNAYCADEGAYWPDWEDLGEFSGEIYVNSSDLKGKILEDCKIWSDDLDDYKDGIVPSDGLIVRKYTVELLARGSSGLTTVTSKMVGYNDDFKISDFSPKAPDGYEYSWIMPGKSGEYGVENIHIGSNVSVSRLTKDGKISLLGLLKEHVYSISYDANGGNGKMSAQEDVKYFSDIVLRKNVMSRRGYVFSGWNTKADGTGKSYSDGETVSSVTNEDEVTLYAQWKKIETITYYLPTSIKNGKFVCSGYGVRVYSGDVKKVLSYKDAAEKKNASGQEKVSDELTYTYVDGDDQEQILTKKWEDIAVFTGWRSAAQTDDIVSFRFPGTAAGSDRNGGSDMTVTESVSFIPDIIYKDLTIGFETDGGEMADVVSEHGQLSADVLQNNTVKEGYEFAGWTVKQMSSETDKKILISAADIARGGMLGESDIYALYMFADEKLRVELKPVWSKLSTYKVQFRANGGSGSMKQVTYICGENRKLPECTFYRKGYIFAGWAVAGEDSISYADGAVICRTAEEGDIRLTAVWSKLNYTLIYDPNGGEGYMPNQTVSSQELHPLKKVGYIKEGAEFLEWNTRPDGSGVSYPDGSNMMHAVKEEGETFTLYAIWNPNIVTLTFNANGGAVAKTSKQVQFGEPCGTLPIPKRSGWAFQGWFTRTKGGTQYTSDTVIDMDCDILLFARWEPQKYTVTFNANGGKLEGMSTMEAAAGKPLGQFPAVTRKGYELEGWYTANEGGAKVNMVYKVNSNITLFAHWKATSKKVRIVMNVAKIAGAKGYELQYSTSAGFAGAVTLTDRMTGAGSYTREVGNLKAETRYYFRVRSYAVRQGKKVYGSWSSVQSKLTSK